MRKSVKRFLSVVLTVAMMMVCFMAVPTTTVSADTTNNIVVEATSVDAMPGDTVQVNINIKSNPGIIAMMLYVEYDKSLLTLVGAEDKGVLGTSQFSDTYGSPFCLAWSDGGAISNHTVTGTIATLTFKVADNVAKNTSATISLSTKSVNDILSVNTSTLETNPVTPDFTNSNVNIFPFTFSSSSITMYDNISMNFKVKSELFTKFGYTNPYVVFEFNNQTYEQKVFTENKGQYSFTFEDIGPKQLKDEIKATLYATKNGQLKNATVNFSVSAYCYGMLAAYGANSNYAELSTLLVDLLNYATNVQLYTNYKSNNLINADLTDAQKAMATATAPTLASDANMTHKTISNPSVTFSGVGLKLSETVEIRVTISAADINGLKLKVVSEDSGYTWYVDASKFVKKSGNDYYVYFNSLKAIQMREVVNISVVKDGVEVSNTVRYDIESYAYLARQQTNPDYDSLKNVTESMMKYGDSAYKYIY